MSKRNDKLNKAFEKLAEIRIQEPSDNMEYHTFSPEFYHETIRKIEEKQKSQRFWLKHAALISKIAFIISLILISSISTFAMYASALIYEIQEFNTTITASGEDTLLKIEDIYLPNSKTIKDFSFVAEQYIQEETIYIREYTTDNDGLLIITQQIKTTYNADSEITNSTELNVHGNAAYFFSKNNQSTLIWAMDDYFFELTIYPEASEEMMLNIAKTFRPEMKFSMLIIIFALNLIVISMIILVVYNRNKKQ